jgi:hypothetical protein
MRLFSEWFAAMTGIANLADLGGSVTLAITTSAEEHFQPWATLQDMAPLTNQSAASAIPRFL